MLCMLGIEVWLIFFENYPTIASIISIIVLVGFGVLIIYAIIYDIKEKRKQLFCVKCGKISKKKYFCSRCGYNLILSNEKERK